MRARLSAVGVVLWLAGCGVPVSDQATTATGDAVPYDLLAADVGATETVGGSQVQGATIWLVGTSGIVPVEREVAPPATIEVVFDTLNDGPTEAEAAFGARSSVPEDAIGDVELADGVATIDLLTAFASASPREQLLALAQLVHTATELDEITAVTFTLDGQPVDVPRGDGSISDRPLRRSDYGSLRAR